MKFTVGALAVLVMLVAITPSAFAISDYQFGLKLGMIDGKDIVSNGIKVNLYVLQPGQGFINQTKEFRDGYIIGYCSVPGKENTGSEADEAGWDCTKGLSSANWLTPNVLPPLETPPLALTGKGAALDRLDNHTQAIQSFDKALSINPYEKHALTGKADALYNQGNYRQAIQYYDRVLDIDPRDKNALEGKGSALFYQGNYTQAIQYYDKALAIDPKDSSALNGRGNAFYLLANDTQGYENAIQSYDKFLAINPKDKYALNNKASALDSIGASLGVSGNYTKAIQYYDKALAIIQTIHMH